MKIVFAGTPEFAVPTLQALHRAGHDIALVVTQPDRPSGRGLNLTPPAVKIAAEELGLPVEQPEKLRGEAGQKILATHQPDAVVIVAYGEIIPGDLLAIPRLGWINLHASLLPRYRGAAPIQWAIVRGEVVTGVTTMQIDEGLDSGPVFLKEEVTIGPEDTTPTLSKKLSPVGAELMVRTLQQLEAGTLQPVPQDQSLATKAPMLKKKHGLLDWNLTAKEIYNRIRGLFPWPGTFTHFRGERLRIWQARPVEAPREEDVPAQPASPGTLFLTKLFGHPRVLVACGVETWLMLEEVQLAGHKRISAGDFANGLHLRAGERFENP
jgi:methionyl-tRNA formyltransferase